MVWQSNTDFIEMNMITLADSACIIGKSFSFHCFLCLGLGAKVSEPESIWEFRKDLEDSTVILGE